MPQPNAAAFYPQGQEHFRLQRGRYLPLCRLHQWPASENFGLPYARTALRPPVGSHLLRVTTHRSAAATALGGAPLAPSGRGFAPPSMNQCYATAICYVSENDCNLLLQFAVSKCNSKLHCCIYFENLLDYYYMWENNVNGLTTA